MDVMHKSVCVLRTRVGLQASAHAIIIIIHIGRLQACMHHERIYIHTRAYMHTLNTSGYLLRQTKTKKNQTISLLA